MKTVDIREKEFEELEDFYMADFKDVDDLLEGIDGQLEKFGLELVVGNREDDNVWVKIQKREKTEK